MSRRMRRNTVRLPRAIRDTRGDLHLFAVHQSGPAYQLRPYSPKEVKTMTNVEQTLHRTLGVGGLFTTIKGQQYTHCVCLFSEPEVGR
jgi:hypothetical protein